MPLTKAEIARLRALREKRAREAEGCFVIEGPKVVAELLAEDCALPELYATPEWPPPAALPPRTRLTVVSPAEMARISHFPTPSCVLAVGRLTGAELLPGEFSAGLTLALDGVQDAGNIGTLLRLADWFGAARMLLSPECADLFSQKVINASMGSFARVRAIRTPLAEALALARAAGVPVLGCDLAGTPVRELAARAGKNVPGSPDEAPMVVVIGSEGRGLSPAVAALLTERITIPRHGRAESLNAAVAAGIVLAFLRN